jgi:hypothetical protein
MDGPADDEIERLLTDRACPWFDALNPSFTVSARLPFLRDAAIDKPRLLHVGWFLAFARSRGCTSPSLESLTDSYVRRHGGSRQPIRDPARGVRNAVRRVGRRPAVEPEYVWVLPPEA